MVKRVVFYDEFGNDEAFFNQKVYGNFFRSELNVLTFLDLSDNKIVEIFDKNFMKSTTLQVLKLGRNRISKIAPKSFEKMLALKSLDISNNKLETFTPEMFNGNSFAGNKLRKLNLSFNLLTTLKENLFSLLLSLTHLDLSSVSID